MQPRSQALSPPSSPPPTKNRVKSLGMRLEQMSSQFRNLFQATLRHVRSRSGVALCLLDLRPSRAAYNLVAGSLPTGFVLTAALAGNWSESKETRGVGEDKRGTGQASRCVCLICVLTARPMPLCHALGAGQLARVHWQNARASGQVDGAGWHSAPGHADPVQGSPHSYGHIRYGTTWLSHLVIGVTRARCLWWFNWCLLLTS